MLRLYNGSIRRINEGTSIIATSFYVGVQAWNDKEDFILKQKIRSNDCWSTKLTALNECGFVPGSASELVMQLWHLQLYPQRCQGGRR